MRKISVAYSPDTDDAFMVYAMKEGLIDCRGYEFEFITGDIQKLNEDALTETYDVTAISMAAYPSMADKYLMMTIGASIGDEFGPAIVVAKDSPIEFVEDLREQKVAVPGKNTSAFFAAMDLFGPFNPEYCRFDAIEGKIKSGEVTGGILIHEPQLDCELLGLKKIGDLGKLWHQKYQLPLPLGANAIRRELGTEMIAELNAIYKESIEYALANRKSTIEKASESAVVGLPYEMADKYIDQYVNERSLDLQKDVLNGIEVLFAAGTKNGLCAEIADKNYICK